jgi:hypothetical protein
MDKEKYLKNLIDRDNLGEKIIYLCQEQIDKLIEIVCKVAEHYEKNDNMTKQDFTRMSMDNINKVQIITEKKQNMLKEYEEKSAILYGETK